MADISSLSSLSGYEEIQDYQGVRRIRMIRNKYSPFETYGEMEFKTRLKFSEATVQELSSNLEDHIQLSRY